MKKILASMVIVMVLVGSVGVYAAEDFVSQMDNETFLSQRVEQIQEALENGEITEEEAALLTAHIEEVAQAGTFGLGPNNGNQGEGSDDCVLGDAGSLGIFRNENAGQKAGSGNGQGLRVADGTGLAAGNGQGNKGQSRGQNSGQGQGFDGVCVLEQ